MDLRPGQGRFPPPAPLPHPRRARPLTRVVDDHGLAEHGRRVPRVGQLGVEVEPEVGVVVHLLVTKDDELPALHGPHVLLQDIVDDGVDVLIHVVEQERGPVLDGDLQLLEEVGVVEGCGLWTGQGQKPLV